MPESLFGKADLEKMLARHRADQPPFTFSEGRGTVVPRCAYCANPYPCDAYLAAKAGLEAMRLGAEMREQFKVYGQGFDGVVRAMNQPDISWENAKLAAMTWIPMMVSASKRIDDAELAWAALEKGEQHVEPAKP